MRLPIVLLLSAIAGMASADQLIDIPTARKIPFEDVKYEFRAAPVVSGDLQHFLGIGIGSSFELDFRDVVNSGLNPVGTFDFSYNYISAVPSVAPGISLGVVDASNLTQDGRRFYVVSTFRNPMDDLPGNLYSDISVGFQAGSLTSPFVGVSVPLGSSFYLLAEHNGFRLSSGVELRPAPHVALRFITRNRETLLSISAMLKF